ncbi:LacI family DNA-binding transcriptional regulator [Babesia caballi]|uniref:LacI family DNA-binding transcriptional regulator n=1 Tax=Babesia caballi TaxID=5871 RepID=A0AAV4M1P3_BABCB|nr:LacI family DNA-binding transcriptional regulator [Babesia caballi]
MLVARNLGWPNPHSRITCGEKPAAPFTESTAHAQSNTQTKIHVVYCTGIVLSVGESGEGCGIHFAERNSGHSALAESQSLPAVMELHKDAFAVYDKTVSVLSVEFERGVYVWVGDEQLSCRDLHCGFPLKNGQGEDSVGSTLIGDLDAISADLAKMLGGADKGAEQNVPSVFHDQRALNKRVEQKGIGEERGSA